MSMTPFLQISAQMPSPRHWSGLTRWMLVSMALESRTPWPELHAVNALPSSGDGRVLVR
jgi:hypothetical protein